MIQALPASFYSTVQPELVRATLVLQPTQITSVLLRGSSELECAALLVELSTPRCGFVLSVRLSTSDPCYQPITLPRDLGRFIQITFVDDARDHVYRFIGDRGRWDLRLPWHEVEDTWFYSTDLRTAERILWDM